MNTESSNNGRFIGIASDHGGFELKEKLLLALELVRIFLNASFKGTERYVRRLNKVSMLESEEPV